jgi:CxxC motif-containing protein
MSEQKKTSFLCIRCPKGCELKVSIEKNDLKVKGNECRIGIEYAIEETKNPRRIVSSTIKIINSNYPRLPVRTKDPIPKNKIKKVIEEIKDKTIKSPVKKDQIIKKNIANTGSDLIAERNMERVKN